VHVETYLLLFLCICIPFEFNSVHFHLCLTSYPQASKRSNRRGFGSTTAASSSVPQRTVDEIIAAEHDDKDLPPPVVSLKKRRSAGRHDDDDEDYDSNGSVDEEPEEEEKAAAPKGAAAYIKSSRVSKALCKLWLWVLFRCLLMRFFVNFFCIFSRLISSVVWRSFIFSIDGLSISFSSV
jgi:hypothetical protein